VDNINLGLLLLRLCLGLFLAYHGYNKFFGGGRIPGTTRWFASMGMKWPRAQALLAACTEIGAGVMFAAGFLTPLAAAGIIGVMLVAIVTEHWKVGFFIFKPNQGWEYCATIAIGALSVATIGAGEWSIDHALDLDVQDWWGLAIAGIVGVGGALLQLATSYRPPKPAPAA
jgi:putative oxidoreductase